VQAAEGEEVAGAYPNVGLPAGLACRTATHGLTSLRQARARAQACGVRAGGGARAAGGPPVPAAGIRSPARPGRSSRLIKTTTLLIQGHRRGTSSTVRLLKGDDRHDTGNHPTFHGTRTIDGIARRDADVAAWFKDSEGNTLCIHETLAA